MTHYHIVSTTGGQVSGPPALVECPDDGAAAEKAKQLLDVGPVEVWNFTRFVARLDPRHKMAVRDRTPLRIASIQPCVELLEQQVSTCFQLALNAPKSEDKAFWLRLADYLLSLRSQERP
jgi:hypothetical protein